ncbi:MAG: SusC/RagA family TonB-linked outer membrane protein [Sphingobacteriaceae bacterium]
MKKNKPIQLLLFMLLCIMSSFAFGQGKRTITGTVKDDYGNPLSQATVTVKGTPQSASTDGSGRYTVSTQQNNPVLVVTFVGFNSKEVKVGDVDVMDITISESVMDMNEVVVTALGVKRDKKSVGYAVQQVKADEITQTAPVDLAQGLMGKVAGLNISTGNGLNNASSRIVIRGNNSLFGNNQPLIVLDGAILDNKPLAQSNISGTENVQDWGNYLSYLNMDNVDNVSVLKGPNAAALYGAKGANGVILITTKKGVDKKGLGVDYRFTTGFTDVYRFQDVQNEYGGGFGAALWTANPELPKTSSGESYLPTLYGGSSYGTGGTGYGGYHGPIPSGNNTWDVFSWFGASASWGPKLNGQMVRWWDGELRAYSPQPNNREFYYKQGQETTHSLSFSAANDFGSIRLAANQTTGDAVTANTNNKNTNFSLGSNIKISKILSAELSASYNQNFRLNAPEVGNNNSWSKFSVYGMSREYQPLEFQYYKNADGSKYSFPSAYPQSEYGNELFWRFYEKNARLNRDEFISTIKLNAEITPWLNAFVRTSVNFIGTDFTSQNNVTTPDKLQGGSFSKTISKDKIYNTDFMVTAHKDEFFLKGLNSSASVLLNTYASRAFGVNASNNSIFAVPNVYSLQNWINRNDTGFGETRYEVESNSILGLLNFSYKDYLFLDLTGRNDINSTLPIESNSYFYPSASLAFVFTEAFNMGKAQDAFSYGKLRLAYGKSANATDPYQLDATYSVGNFGGQPTNSLPGTVPPYRLRFQTSKSLEIGASLGFLKNRINLDFTYYNILSDNQIMTSSLATSSGATGVTFNSGALRNRGVEMIISAIPVSSKNFSWNLMLNAAHNDNYILSLAPGIREQRIADVFGSLGAFMKVAPGEKYGTIYGTDFKRDDQGRKLIKNVTDGTGKVFGTVYQATDDPVAIGNASAKFTGGLGNTIRYKNFSLYGLIDFKVGGDIYSFDHSTAMGSGLSPATLIERNGGGLPYTFPDGTTGNVGVILDGYNVDDAKVNDRVVNYMYKYAGSYTGWTNINRPRSLSIFENSWAKLREVALTYALPQNIVEKTKVFQNLSVSVTGRNLFYLYTSLPDHLNPEAINGVGNGQGLQWSAFPSIRTIGMSVKAQF